MPARTTAILGAVLHADVHEPSPHADTQLSRDCHPGFIGLPETPENAAEPPMRYTLVSETYPPEVNGVALTVQELERGLRLLGNEVTVIRPRQRPDETAATDEVLVPGLDLPLYQGLKLGLPVTRVLRRQWMASRPDAIYVATEGPLGWAAVRAARQLSIPVATGLHTRFDIYLGDYGWGALTSLARAWMRFFHNRANATLVPTRQLENYLHENGYRNPKRLARAVDTELFNPARRDQALRAQWGLAKDDLAIIHVGRIAAEKNLSLAIEAFRSLQELRRGARFIWVGDGPLRESLQRENPDFVFCGVHRGAELARHYASADLFLFPSRSETFGNVTLESMASGVATIAFDEGAAHEHLENGRHGVTVTRDDDFIRSAEWLATDDQARQAFAVSAREATRHLSLQQVAADFEAILQELQRSSGQRSRSPEPVENKPLAQAHSACTARIKSR